jgi:hypothetical protein
VGAGGNDQGVGPLTFYVFLNKRRSFLAAKVVMIPTNRNTTLIHGHFAKLFYIKGISNATP